MVVVLSGRQIRDIHLELKVSTKKAYHDDGSDSDILFISIRTNLLVRHGLKTCCVCPAGSPVVRDIGLGADTSP